jgi:hypothetical protein
MELKRALSLTAVGIALVLAIAVTGCGGGGDDEGDLARAEGSQTKVQGSPAYVKVLEGLKAAASSNETYQAVRRATKLKAAERAVVNEFCNFVWQIKINNEEVYLGKREYIADRILSYAAYNRNKAFSTAAAKAAVDQLQVVIDLASVDSGQLKPYLSACYK